MATEEILLQDGVSGPADQAAGAMLAYAKAAQQATAATKAMNNALSMAGKATGAEKKELESLAVAASKSATAAKGAMAQAIPPKAVAAGADNATAAFGRMFVAVNMISSVVKGGWNLFKDFFKGVTAGLTDFVTGISDAKIQNDKFRQSMDQMTKGRGIEAMSHLTALAKDLGKGTAEVVEQFTAFREGGLNNIQSSKLIKLRADLDATGVSAGVADKAMTEAMKALKGGAKIEDVVAKIAKQFGAAGDGANAAAKRGASWEGALDNLGQAWDRVKARIANAVGPALDRLGTKFTAFLDKAESSGELDSFIDGIGEALDDIDSVITDVQSAFTACKEAATGFFEGLDNSGGVETLVEGIKALSEAFGGTSGAASNASASGNAFGEAVGVLAGALGLLASAIAGVISMIGSLKNALNGGVGDMKQSSTQVEMSAGKWEAAGASAGQGFANGIKGKTGEVTAAASGLGAAADAALGSSLEIKSPSKVAERYGFNFGQSFTDAMNDTLPTTVATPESDNGTVGAALPARSTGATTIAVTVNAETNASADDIAIAIRREIESHMRMVAS